MLNRTLFLPGLLLLLTVHSYGQINRRFLIDFGSPTNQTSATGWNNVTEVVNGTLVNLVESNGTFSTLNIEVITEPANGYGGGGDFNPDGYNGQVLDYPASACGDSHYSYLTGGTYRLNGLDNTKTYNLKIFAARSPVSDSRVGTYTINGQQLSLNAANNTSQTVEFTNIVPASGSITIAFGVGSGSGFGYLNVLDIVENGSATLGAPTNLTTQVSGANVLLNWTDNSTSEDGFKIERKLSTDSQWVEVGQVNANVIQFTNVSPSSGYTYDYRVYAFSSTQQSPYSNTSSVQINSTPTPSGDRRFLIDFGSPTNQTNVTGWNNVTNVVNGAIVSLVESNGTTSTLNLEVVTKSGNGFGDGGDFNPDGYHGQVLDYPASACGDSHFSYLTGGTYRLNGLDNTKTYNLKIFAARSPVTDSRVGTYTINGQQLSLNAANNTSQTVEFTNIVPASGSITIAFGVGSGSGFGYLNVLDITEASSGVLQAPTNLIAQSSGSDLIMTWTDNSTSEEGFRVERKLFTDTQWTQIGQVAANVVQFTDVSPASGTYDYRVYAYTSSQQSGYSNTLSLPVNTASSDRRFLIDFGSSATQTSVTGWNNVTDVVNGTVINLVESGGNTSALTFEVITEPANGYGGGSDFNPDGHNFQVGDYPASACRDSHYSYQTGGTYRLNGLDNTKAYNLRIFAARSPVSDSRVGTYTINGQQLSLDAANNTSQTIEFANITPTNGTITISFGVGSGSTFGYLNVLDITELGEGTSLAIPTLLSLLQTSKGITLTWLDNSNNETGFEIERSNSINGTYTILTTTSANVSTYTDATAGAEELYYYRVRAIAGSNVSDYSNILASTSDFIAPVVSAIENRSMNAGSLEEILVSVSTADNTPLDRNTIVILGSSTAAGHGASNSSMAWVPLYTNFANSFTEPFQVVNLALGGFATDDILPSGDPVRNINAALSHNPLMIIINLPSNDVADGVSTAVMMNNLATVKQLAEASGVKVFITTTQPRNFTNQAQRQELQSQATALLTTYGNETINIYQELADGNLNIKSQYNSGDGIHVNDAGHNYIFQQIKTYTESFLKKTRFVYSLIQAPSFATIQNLGQGKGKIILNPSLTDAGNYNNIGVTVQNLNGSNSSQQFSVEVLAIDPLKNTLDNWSFQYRYDARKRMIKKKVPGADWVYMVYDDRDRLVMTQDGNQRAASPKEWTFTKYDVLNRPILTGIYKDTQNRELDVMQAAVNTFYQSNPFYEIAGSAVHGYTNQSFPSVSTEADYLSVTYYDNYTMADSWGPAYAYEDLVLTETVNAVTYTQPEARFSRVVGQVTAAKTKNLDDNTWLKIVNYYDDKYRVVQSVMDNHLGGIDKTTSLYDFVGKVLKTKNSNRSGQFVQWTNIATAQVQEVDLVAVGGYGSGSSVQILPAGVDGWAEMTLVDQDPVLYFGLSDQDINALPSTMDYAIALNYPYIMIYENGQYVKTISSRRPDPGDVFRIERVNGQIHYKENSTVIHVSIIPSSTQLVVDVSTLLNGKRISKPRLSGQFSPNNNANSVERRLEYDHAGRLLKTYHRINNEEEVLLAQNEYNELGQLITKKLHNENNETDFKQNVDYRYNIRGWLTRINNSDLNNNSDDGPRDYFGMNLLYNQQDATLNNASQFNGNISAIKWSNNLGLGNAEPTQRAYTYTYDPMNRLKTASHHEAVSTWNPTAAFEESISAYDLNGNIKALHRTTTAGDVMDELAYNYGENTSSHSNRLLSVSDTGDLTKGFKDGNLVGDDYFYDANGNMKKDKNKDITTITYNHLNLATTVTKSNGEYIKYIYDATGRKLSQEVYDATQTLKKKSDYAGEFFYENDTLKFINHEEGRITMVTPDGTPETTYQYHLKDHLGNVRLTFTTKEETDAATATMETAHAEEEQSEFLNYAEVRKINSALFDHTNEGTTFNSVRLMGGNTTERYGLAKSLSVMPGDVINMEVYAKYLDTDPGNWSTALRNAIIAIAGTANPGGTFVDGGPIGGTDGPFPYPDIDKSSDNSDGPKAYLNYILFDREGSFLDGGFKSLTSLSREDGQGTDQINGTPHEHLFFEDIVIEQPGYVYIYLSNENETPVEVFFDDFKVEHTKSPVVQVDDYYPFGLTFNSYQRENNYNNRFLFNGSSELIELFDNSWYQTKYRLYDAQLGRFWGIDKLCDYVSSVSPMIFSFNNPISFNDPLGLLPGDPDPIYIDPNNYILNEVTVTASRPQPVNYDQLFLDQYMYSSSPIKRAAAIGYKNGGLREVNRLLNTGRMIHINKYHQDSKFSKEFTRFAGLAMNGLSGIMMLTAGAPMVMEYLVEAAPQTVGQKALNGSLDLGSQLLSGKSLGDVDFFDVGASTFLGFNTFGSVLVNSNIDLSANNGITSEFGTVNGVLNMGTGFVAAGINEGFIDKQVTSEISKVVLKFSVGHITSIVNESLTKSVKLNENKSE